jgi:hypothetical protein
MSSLTMATLGFSELETLVRMHALKDTHIVAAILRARARELLQGEHGQRQLARALAMLWGAAECERNFQTPDQPLQ